MFRRASVLAVAAASAALLAPSPARAADNDIGDKGQLIVSGERLMSFFSFARASITDTQNNVTTTTAETSSSIALLFGGNALEQGIRGVHSTPRIGFDYTPIPHLTVGGSVLLGFGLGGSTSRKTVSGGTTTTTSNDTPTTDVIGIAPRVGYLLPLGDLLAVWPRGGLAFYDVHRKTQTSTGGNPPATTTDTTTDTVFSLDLDPELVLVPVQHFYFGIGPTVSIPLTGGHSTSTTAGPSTTTVSDDLAVFHIGLAASLGGYFSL